MPLSRGSFQSRDWSQVSRIAGRFFTIWATRETPALPIFHKWSLRYMRMWLWNLETVKDTGWSERMYFSFLSAGSSTCLRRLIRERGKFICVSQGGLTGRKNLGALPLWFRGKESTCNEGVTGDSGSIPGSGRSPGERQGKPLQYFLPGESHGLRRLEGYSLRVAKNRIQLKQLHAWSQGFGIWQIT